MYNKYRFRTWHRDEQKFLSHSQTLRLLLDINAYVIPTECLDCYTIELGTCVNGLDVYVGDIIEIEGIVPLTVGYKDGCFTVSNIVPVEPLVTRLEHYKEWGSPKIIGNIHENPEMQRH